MGLIPDGGTKIPHATGAKPMSCREKPTPVPPEPGALESMLHSSEHSFLVSFAGFSAKEVRTLALL